MAAICRFRSRAACAAAPPSMIAIRDPTGELPGRLPRLSGRTTRTRSGSIPSSSPTTVAASVSCPWPELVVWIATVTCPSASTVTRLPSIQVDVRFASFRSGSKDELPPDGSRQAATPMPAASPSPRSRSRSALSAS